MVEGICTSVQSVHIKLHREGAICRELAVKSELNWQVISLASNSGCRSRYGCQERSRACSEHQSSEGGSSDLTQTNQNRICYGKVEGGTHGAPP